MSLNRRFLLYYGIIVLIPLVMGSVFYIRSLGDALERIGATNQDRIEDFEQDFSDLTEDMADIGAHTVLDPVFQGELSAGTGGASPFRTWRLLSANSFLPYSLTNPYIAEYYLFTLDPPLVLGPNFAAGIESFWNYIYRIGDFAPDKWLETFLHSRQAEGFYPQLKIIDLAQGEESDTLPYIKSFPLNGNRSGLILFLIDRKRIIDWMNTIPHQENGTVMLFSESGELIISNHPEDAERLRPNLKNLSPGAMQRSGDHFYSIARMPSTSWMIVIAQSVRDLRAEAAFISRLTLMLTLILSAGGALAALLISYLTSRPLFSIIRELRTNRLESQLDYSGDLASIFNELSGLNRALMEEIKRRRPAAEQLFYRSLLAGDLSDPEIEENLARLDISFHGTYVSAACAEFGNPRAEENILLQAGVGELVRRNSREDIRMAEIGPARFALIASFNAEDTEEALSKSDELLRDFVAELEEILEDSFRVGMGLPRLQVNDLYRSFSEAQIALRNSPQAAPFFAVYGTGRSDIVPVYLPPAVESRLINLIKLGQSDEVMKIVEELRFRNLNQETGEEMQRLFLQNLLKCVLNAFIEAGIDEEGLERELKTLSLTPIHSTSQRFDNLRTIIYRISSTQSGRHDQEKQKTLKRITDYLEEHFHEPSLDLNSVADEFQLSAFYFSRLFSQLAGEHFRTYLEKLRMDAICAKLVESNDPLKEIARSVGYSSLNTFSKVFKRRFGMSATEYRRMNS